MKKAIAFVLAMLMVLSIVPLAFAENETVNGTTDDVPVEDGNETSGEPEEPETDGNETEEPELPAGDGNETEEPEADGNETEEPEADGNETEEPEADGNETEEPEADGNETEEPEADGNETEEEEEEEDVVEISEEVTEEAGITPDSWLWGLERAIERISLKLTIGKSAKAKKGLAHARERLMEVQAMIAAKRMAKAGEAQEAYEETMEEVEENVAELGDGDAIEELEDETEIEQALAENEALVEATNQLRVKVKAKGLTAEQEAQLNQIVNSLGDATGKLDMQVKAKKEKTMIKIKAKGGFTDEEVAAIASQVEEAVASGQKVKLKIKNNNKGKNRGGDDEDEEEEVEVEVEVENEGDDNETEVEVEEEEADENETEEPEEEEEPKITGRDKNR